MGVMPWDETGETKIEYCRRVVREHKRRRGKDQKRFRLHIIEERSGQMISSDFWQWRMIAGAAVSIKGHRYRVMRITPHPAVGGADLVWVEREK